VARQWFGRSRGSNLGRNKKFIASLSVQTASRAHLVSYSIDNADPFAGIKQTGREAKNTPPFSDEVKNV
jgi:hypothetical protein